MSLIVGLEMNKKLSGALKMKFSRALVSLIYDFGYYWTDSQIFSQVWLLQHAKGVYGAVSVYLPHLGILNSAEQIDKYYSFCASTYSTSSGSFAGSSP